LRPLALRAAACYITKTFKTTMKKQLSNYSGNIGYFAGTEFGRNIFRFGMSFNGRSPYDRWDHDGDYAKCGNPAQFEHEFYELGDKKDHDIHALLKDHPSIRLVDSSVVRSSEVFECDLGLEFAKHLVENLIVEVTGKATPIRQPIAARPYQSAFVNQFATTKGDFCLFAKCRSGKSAMTLLAATECNYGSLLVVSYRTSAGNSWLHDTKTYTVFHEWDVINLKDPNWKQQVTASQKANRRQLLFSTVQRQRETLGHSKMLRELYPQGVDLLALDECHIGGESDEFDRLKKAFSYKRLLEISGTAYKSIWKYPRENVFVWGYVEEQRAKAEGAEWAQVLPKMQLVFATYNAAELKRIYGRDPDALKNVFSTEMGEWKSKASVQAFLRKFFAYGSMCRKQEQMLYDSQHIVMSLPSVEACYLFAESLRKFGSQFVPLVITGDSGENQRSILRHVEAHPATICLTRWANVVGVTVPQWDTVIHGCEYQSAEFWVQFSFRGGSTRSESWKVIEFVPERAVQSIVEMASVTATVSNEADANGVLRTFVDFADVFEFAEGYRKLDYGSVLRFGNVAAASAKAITNAAVSATRVGTDVEALAWAFSDLDKISDIEMVREVLNSNGTEGSSNAQNVGANGLRDEDNKIVRETLARVKTAVSKIDDVVLHGLLLDQHLSTLPKLLSYEKFELVTGCHPDLFRTAIETGWVNERVVSNSVSQVHIVLDSMLAPLL
jgi:hypothetical protein